MPYDRRHIVIQWGGTLPGGEIWSNMFRGGGDTTGPGAYVPTHSEMDAWLHGEVKDEVAAWHARATTQIYPTCKLAYVKANVVDMNGHYVEQTTLVHNYAPVISGGGSGTLHPTQVAWVVSLTTAYARGPAHRGRIYVPLPGVAISGTDGMVSATDATSLATSAKTFIETLADTPGVDAGAPFKVLVMSKTGPNGATNPVTGVQVGRVLDTQTRRRNALGENYVSAAIDQGSD